MAEGFSQHLVEKVLDDCGLAYLVLALEDKINKPILIANQMGKIIFSHCPGNQEMTQEVPEESLASNKEYEYDTQGKRLTYVLGDNGQGFVVLGNVEEKEVEAMLWWLKEVSLALRVYFSSYYAVEKVEQKYKNKMIQDILHNNIVNPTELKSKAELWGWNLEQGFFVSLIESDVPIDLQLLTQYASQIQWEEDIIFTIRDNMLIILCPVADKHLQQRINELVEGLRVINSQLTDNFGFSFSMGIGQYYPKIEDAHRSFQEAKMTLVISRLMGEVGFVRRFVELGILRLLYNCEDYLLEEYQKETLGQLLEYDKSHKGDLTHTLEVFFANNLDLGKTAEALFVHVNTLRYRMKKIEELLQLDFSRLPNQINLFVALKIQGFLNNKRGS